MKKDIDLTRLFLIFNHKLTNDQIKSARDQLNIDNFIYLPDELQKIWNTINPEGILEMENLKMITDWMKSETVKSDYILIQGDFGATFYLVDFCFKNDLVPIYATTIREVIEKTEDNGTVKKTNVFKHINFRIYERWKDE